MPNNVTNIKDFKDEDNQEVSKARLEERLQENKRTIDGLKNTISTLENKHRHAQEMMYVFGFILTFLFGIVVGIGLSTVYSWFLWLVSYLTV